MDSPGKSNNGSGRIITTTRCDLAVGFGAFDLTRKVLQVFLAGEPDNVGALCGAKVRSRTMDLVVVAFRRDKTIRYVSWGVGCE